MTIWLVVIMLIHGEHPVTVEDSIQPDRATCFAKGAAVLEKYSQIEGEFELQVTCSIVKPQADPA